MYTRMYMNSTSAVYKLLTKVPGNVMMNLLAHACDLRIILQWFKFV
jgi:hypothetical protein